ncbi:sperm equatorial segment protein 1 isoform X1 [Rattus norvegicus]|uniref:Sperm equatorial segment protein 1 n=1 Tax=Rattus norvegicus TaxID=10116 RepID=A0A8I6A6I5_RAT|nr:sperm equatorial segment protein 1 isoform X1 [Rattus norvegicus]|eukprot:XP_006243272.1 PREDICTED: sperm equatorial segment protein 1 isoform X1 [Rattus norvegicus]
MEAELSLVQVICVCSVIPAATVLPDEEQNLNHYVQILQNLIMSVPTKEQGFGRKFRSSRTVDGAEARSLSSEMLLTPGLVSAQEVTTPETEVMLTSMVEKTTFPSSGFTMESEKRRTHSKAFWSIQPNNVSIVLHTEEPYIEKEPEPEPELETEEESRRLATEPEPEPESESAPETETRQTAESEEEVETSTAQNKVRTGTSRMSTVITQTTNTQGTPNTVTVKTINNLDVSTESEDVPQLSGQSEILNVEDLPGHHSLSTRHENILRKISNINSQIHQGLLSDHSSPAYKEFIKASREHLKRSLALAAAAEHKLQQMYGSNVFLDGHTSDPDDDMEVIINMLYNSRSKLSDYFTINHVPSELREKATVVIAVLKKILCVDQVEMQSLIRKLLSNNMKILNILNVP